MSNERLDYQTPIIDHVPSPEELAAAAKVEAEHNLEHAIPREQVDALLHGMGISTPDRSTSQPETSPRQTQPIRHYEAPAHEPYVPQEHELPVSAQELQRLREQIAMEDSKKTR